jgi:hypothetical protein
MLHRHHHGHFCPHCQPHHDLSWNHEHVGHAALDYRQNPSHRYSYHHEEFPHQGEKYFAHDGWERHYEDRDNRFEKTDYVGRPGQRPSYYDSHIHGQWGYPYTNYLSNSRSPYYGAGHPHYKGTEHYGIEGEWSRNPHYSFYNYSGRGPKDWTRSDERIREDLNERLAQDPWIDASEINVEVKNSEITLKGSVEGRDARRRADEIAESVVGATQVHNHLRVESYEDRDSRKTYTAYPSREKEVHTTSRKS